MRTVLTGIMLAAFLAAGIIIALAFAANVAAAECPEPPSAPYELTGTQFWMNTADGVDANGCTIWLSTFGGDPDAEHETPPGLSPSELGHVPIALPDTAMEH